MPQYSFKCPKCKNEQTVTRVMADYDKPLKCEKCKAKMTRLLVFNSPKKRCDTYPYASYAVGIDPSEVPAQRKLDKAAGVPTEYKHGDPVFTSRNHRKRYLKHIQFHDRNSYDGN